MDRRYDQPPRDRYMYSRPRFEERPNVRDERYFRRDDGPNRPWSHPRYPPFPQPSSRRSPHDGPPHYIQERREHYKPYDRRQPPRNEPERFPSSRFMDRREVKSVIVTSNTRRVEKDMQIDEKHETKEIPATKESSKEEPVNQSEEPVKKTRVYKEAVVTFDSDGEDDVMQADWGNESDDTSLEPQQKVSRENIEQEKIVDESLPESWAMHVSDKGEKYYYNKITRESVWEKPTLDTVATVTTTTTTTIIAKEQEENQVAVKDMVDTNKGTNDSGNNKKEIDKSIPNKRKFVLPDREEPRLPNSLANRISYPRPTNANNDPILHHHHHPYARRFEPRDRPLPPQIPRVHHHNEYRSNNRYNHGPPHAGPPSPPSDRYYRSNIPPHNGREPWIHHSPYRHHQMDYAPLPPPPPPRWVSGRRVDFDRRDAPPPYINRNTRDYR